MTSTIWPLVADGIQQSNMDEIYSKYILDLMSVTSVESKSLHVTSENIWLWLIWCNNKGNTITLKLTTKKKALLLYQNVNNFIKKVLLIFNSKKNSVSASFKYFSGHKYWFCFKEDGSFNIYLRLIQHLFSILLLSSGLRGEEEWGRLRTNVNLLTSLLFPTNIRSDLASLL